MGRPLAICAAAIFVVAACGGTPSTAGSVATVLPTGAPTERVTAAPSVAVSSPIAATPGASVGPAVTAPPPTATGGTSARTATPAPTTERSAPPASTAARTARPASTVSASVSVEVVARGLDTPWALAFAPDGRIFVTERPGRIRVIQGGVLQPDPWATLAVTERDGAEKGLMGVAVDPAFARNGFVYVAYTYRSGTRDMNKLVRLRDSGGRGVEETAILDGGTGGDNHDGGRVKIGPDGKLWWALGESGTDAQVAQKPDRINGKILRLELDGRVPADNPTPGSHVWSLGHRNPQGIAWHPDTGALYSTEHGPSMNGTSFCCHDEVNLIVPGGNYGWPTVWGIARDPRYRDPVHESGASETWAPGGAAFVSSGPLRGSLLFAALRGQHVHRLVFGPDGTVAFEERLLASQYGRIREVAEGPDGAIYVTTSNRDGRGSARADDDRVLRLTFR